MFACGYASSPHTHLPLAALHRLQTLAINIYLCVWPCTSNGVEPDSDCQSSCAAAGENLNCCCVCVPSNRLYTCVWVLESIRLTSISASPLSLTEPPPNNKNHYSHFAAHLWVIPLCQVTTPQDYFCSLVIHPLCFHPVQSISSLFTSRTPVCVVFSKPSLKVCCLELSRTLTIDMYA